MQESKFVLPPFLPDEILFLIPDDQSRSITAMDNLIETVSDFGGYMAGGRDLESEPCLLPGKESMFLVAAEGFKTKRVDEAYELFRAIDERLKEKDGSIIWQPNWVTGMASGNPGGGGGAAAGPGARPLPVRQSIADRPLPLRRDFIERLRKDAQSDEPVRMVILDAWNGNRSETTRLSELPLYRLVNDYCQGAPFRLRDYYASRDGDPFPMPDHGLFAAYLAGEVIGMDRLSLHDSIFARLSGDDQVLMAPFSAGASGSVTLEGIRVLDEYGVGDSRRLIETLVRVADSIKPGERVIVNISLVVTIPQDPMPRIFADRWPGQGNRPDRLDRALHDAIRALHDRGALLVAAAGNDSWGDALRVPARFPAAYDEVVDVTAASPDGSGEAWYANRATKKGVALFAGETTSDGLLDDRHPLTGPFSDSHVPVPGVNNDPENVYGAVAWAGTSFAAPMASGLAALLWQADPSRSARDVRAELLALAGGQTLSSGTPYIDLLDFEGEMMSV